MIKKYFVIYLVVFFLLNILYFVTELNGEYLLLRKGDLSIRTIPEAEVNNKIWREESLYRLKGNYYRIGLWRHRVMKYVIQVMVLNFFIVIISIIIPFIFDKIMYSINKLKNNISKE